MQQAHYFALPSQGNIYTSTVLHQLNGHKMLLVGTLEREIFCLEYPDNENDALIPSVKQLSFTYIPSDSEIISMDAYNKSTENDDFVVGITIVKCNSDTNVTAKSCSYLNIYSQWEKSTVLNIENIAQNCLNVELSFIPYQLTHTQLVTWTDDRISENETVFLLTGSDNQIHIYKENQSNHIYAEVPYAGIFNEFRDPPSVVMWVEIKYFNNYEDRITAFGCECGHIKLFRINLKTREHFKFYTVVPSGISKLIIYEEETNQIQNSKLKNIIKKKSKLEGIDKLKLDLVVINANMQPIFFKDILNYGFNDHTGFRMKRSTEVLTCGEVGDINFDGIKEVLIGSSAQEVSIFQRDKLGQWNIIDKIRIVSPIFQLRYIDITGDGVRELIIFTMKGIYILKHKHEDVEKSIMEKLDKLTIEQN